ncbi:hypothetical protein P3W33_14035 [Luteibacter sp. PPL552]
MTRRYEIPYHAEDGKRWPVRLEGVAVGYFASRFEALRDAVSRAASDGGEACIRVEGADGVWRPFGSDAKRPFDTPPPAPRLSVVR